MTAADRFSRTLSLLAFAPLVLGLVLIAIFTVVMQPTPAVADGAQAAPATPVVSESQAG